MEELSLFTENDRHPRTGMPRSEYPGWYFTEHINELKETIARSRRMIETGAIPDRNLPQARADLSVNETKLQNLLDAVPKVSDFHLDKYAEIKAELGTKISESMFTYSDMQRGTADAHEEARRMLDRCIEIRGDVFTFVKSCGIRIEDGKISRNDASRAWKILAKFLGQNTNVETLRREK